MGIMNKMKTVALKDLTWVKDGNYYKTTTVLPNAKFPGTSTAFIGYCSKDYTPIGIGPLLPGTEQRIAITSSKTLYVRDSRFTTAEALVQYITENNITITYETIDSVEEKIVTSHLVVDLADGPYRIVSYEAANRQFYSNVLPDSVKINSGWLTRFVNNTEYTENTAGQWSGDMLIGINGNRRIYIRDYRYISPQDLRDHLKTINHQIAIQLNNPYTEEII